MLERAAKEDKSWCAWAAIAFKLGRRVFDANLQASKGTPAVSSGGCDYFQPRFNTSDSGLLNSYPSAKRP